LTLASSPNSRIRDMHPGILGEPLGFAGLPVAGVISIGFLRGCPLRMLGHLSG